MKYTKLGNSGIQVSKIGIGAWQASDDWHGDERAISKAIGRALELGVNLVDTAEAYGNGSSERVVGKALKTFGRENFVVATKVHGAHLRYEELQRACAGSLRRLGVREIDLYQVHWPDPWEQIPLKHTMKALEKLYREGKIRAIGASNFAVRDLVEARSYLAKADIVSNQVRYNLLQRDVEEEVLPYCTRENIAIIAWSPLAQGALTKNYDARNLPRKDVRKTNPLFSPRNITAAKKVLAVVSSIAKNRGCTPAQVALAWLARIRVVIPIPGAKNPEQAGENALAVELRLNRSELNSIKDP